MSVFHALHPAGALVTDAAPAPGLADRLGYACWLQDLPQGELEPWTDIQVTNVFNGNGKNGSSSSSGRRLLSEEGLGLLSKLRRLQQAPGANASASYNQDLTQEGELPVGSLVQGLTGAWVALGAGLHCRGDAGDACRALLVKQEWLMLYSGPRAGDDKRACRAQRACAGTQPMVLLTSAAEVAAIAVLGT